VSVPMGEIDFIFGVWSSWGRAERGGRRSGGILLMGSLGELEQGEGTPDSALVCVEEV